MGDLVTLVEDLCSRDPLIFYSADREALLTSLAEIKRKFALSSKTPQVKVCEEILEIMATYREQEDEGHVDSPGGLEHMGDVWSLLRKCEKMITVEAKHGTHT